MNALFVAVSVVALCAPPFVAMSSAKEVGGNMVVVLADCNCTPKLDVSISCSPLMNILDLECVVVEFAEGASNNPKCNAHLGCEQLINCDAAAGSAVITYKSSEGLCVDCSSISIMLNLSNAGTIQIPGSAFTLKVGGSAVACTNVDNTEGSGEVVRVSCPGGSPSAYCDFTVKDKCLKCPG